MARFNFIFHKNFFNVYIFSLREHGQGMGI